MQKMLKILLATTALQFVGNAYALNECGTVTVGGTITCTAGTYNRIEYRIKDVTVILDNGVAVVNSTRGVQVGQSTGDMGDVTVIAKTGSSSHLLNLTGTWRGIGAMSGSGSVFIISEANIDTTEAVNTYIHGLYGYVNNSGSIAEGGSITITALGGTIDTATTASDGIHARVDNATTGNITITSDATITTAGKWGDGIHARSNTNLSGNVIDILNTGVITTLGDQAHGILAEANKATTSADMIITNEGNITTSGAKSNGLTVKNKSTGNATINTQNGGVIDTSATTSGSAIDVYSVGGTYVINTDDTTLIGGSDEGAVINLVTYNGGQINLGSSSILDGALSGVAIRDNDDDTSNSGGAIVSDTIVTTYATITGDVLLNNGSDIVNYFGGDIDGQINGGDDISTDDGYIDALNIQNYTGLAADIDYINFEDVNIANSTIDFGDSYSSPESINYTVAEDATINMTGGGAGDYTINSNVENNGLFDFVDGTVGDHLTIIGHDTAGGDLIGTGTFAFDTDFYNKESDYITVNGNVAANGIIAINDVTSYSYNEYYNTDTAAAEVTQASNGAILLIEAPNDSDKSDEDFNLAAANQYNGEGKLGRFTGNPFVWALGTSGNDWVLTYASDIRPEYIEPTIVAEIPAYTSLPTIGREIVMDELGTLHTRLGELRNNQGWVGTGDSNLKTNLGSEWHNAIGFDDSKANAWLKGTISHFDISSDNSFDVSGTYGGFNLGIDKKFDLGNSSPDWSVFTGLFGGYKTGSFETSGKGNQYTSNEHADIDIDAWSIGGYATFFNTAGTYIDLVAEYMDLSADIDAAGLNSSTNGYALAGSIEVGHSFDLAKDWIIEPQAQVKLAHINWDDFNDSVNDVSFEDHTYVTGRAGVRVEKNIETSYGEIKPWAYIGVLHEFTDAPEVTYANTIFEAVDYNTAGEIKLGITADVYQSVQMYADIGYATDFSDYNSIKGDLGLRITW